MDAEVRGLTWKRLYWKVALATGVPFGVLMSAYDLLVRGPWWKRGWGWFLGYGTAMGSLFGLVMAATLVALARKGGSPQPEPVRQVRTVEIPCNREEGVRRGIAAMAVLRGSSAPKFDAGISTIVKRTGLSWKSNGEVVTIRVEPVAGDSCRVYVESRPRLPWTLIDLGVNRKNADAVVNALQTGG